MRNELDGLLLTLIYEGGGSDAEDGLVDVIAVEEDVEEVLIDGILVLFDETDVFR